MDPVPLANYLEDCCWWLGSSNETSGLSLGQLSKLLCLFDSKSSDFSSWVDLRKDSLSPSIPSSFEFRWSCRFEDARGKLSALRTFRHNFDVEPCRLKNSCENPMRKTALRAQSVTSRSLALFTGYFEPSFPNGTSLLLFSPAKRWRSKKNVTRKRERERDGAYLSRVRIRIWRVYTNFSRAWKIGYEKNGEGERREGKNVAFVIAMAVHCDDEGGGKERIRTTYVRYERNERGLSINPWTTPRLRLPWTLTFLTCLSILYTALFRALVTYFNT